MSSIFGKKKNNGGGLFLSVMQGFFRQKVTAETESAVMRINKKKEEVWELLHETVIGHITNVWMRKNTRYGNELCIAINNKDANARATISVPISSSYTRKFFMVVGSLDFNAPVEFSPFYFEDKKKAGKFITGWNLFQHDSKDQVPEYIDRKLVPEIIEKKTVKGTEYDDTEAMEYLYNKFLRIAAKYGFKEPDSKSDDDDDDDRHQEKYSRGSQGNKQYAEDDEEDEQTNQPSRKQDVPDF